MQPAITRWIFTAVLMLCSLTAIASQEPNADALKARYFDAARAGNIELLSAFYDAGVNANVADEKGYTALILAAYHGHQKAVTYLIETAHADTCQEDNKGNTALMGAIFKGHLTVAKQLMFADCNVDAQNQQGQTALMFASLFDRQELVQELIASGANPQHKDLSGNSVADIALSQGNYALAEALSRTPSRTSADK